MDVSDRWLRTFVAVAEEGSFTAGARSLGVGQPAVSHAVARLEAALGVELFERSPGGLRLTGPGRLLHRRTSVALADIDDVVRTIGGMVAANVISLSVSTSLANFWLLPRLPDFKHHHPDIELRVITTDGDDGVGRDDADLWIPLGLVDRPHLKATLFRVERIVPVAAPSLADSVLNGGTLAPIDLLDRPLVHLEERYRPRYSWDRWFTDHRVPVESSLPGYRTNDYSLVLQAALDGHGVALGWEHIVTRLLADRRLVALAPPIETGQPFPIMERRTVGTSARSAAIAVLRDWLIESP